MTALNIFEPTLARAVHATIFSTQIMWELRGIRSAIVIVSVRHSTY